MENGAVGVRTVLVPQHAVMEPKREHELVKTISRLKMDIAVLATLHLQLRVTTGIVQASYSMFISYLYLS